MVQIVRNVSSIEPNFRKHPDQLIYNVIIRIFVNQSEHVCSIFEVGPVIGKLLLDVFQFVDYCWIGNFYRCRRLIVYMKFSIHSFQGSLNLRPRHSRCIHLLSKELDEGTKLLQNLLPISPPRILHT